MTDSILSTTEDCRTQHLDDAILKFVTGQWKGGFKFNAQPIDKRMDVFAVMKEEADSRMAKIIIRNLRTGDIDYIYHWKSIDFDSLRVFLLDWLSAVEATHTHDCFERHVAWKKSPEGQNWYIQIPSA